VPKGFFPVQDTGVVMGISEARESVSFAEMSSRQQALGRVILKDPDVESLTSFIGIDGVNPTMNSGRIQINLKPLEDRSARAPEIIRRLQPKLAQVEGITLYLQPVQDLTIESRVSRTQYQYSLEDADANELAQWVPRLMDVLGRRTELRDIASDLQTGGLKTTLVIDRDTAARLGITPQNIDDTLYDAFGQRQISTIFTQLNQYHVVLEVDPRFQKTPEDLTRIYVHATGAPAAGPPGGGAAGAGGAAAATTGPRGTEIPLSEIARFEQGNTPLVVSHQGQFPVVTLSFNLAPGVSLGEAVDVIHTAEQQIGFPQSIQASFQGSAAAFQNSLAGEPLLILAALVTVYIVLGVLYESYIHPITILSTLPSAGVGAILALLLTHNDFNVISLIGVILLIGIVKKNAIMMIDFALEAEREQGKTPDEAIYQACLLRFRPIMMTTMAALLGGIPLALGTGTGSELRHPLGITIVGGLIVSQVLTLYTTPVVYLFFDRFPKRVRVPNAGYPAAPHPSPAAPQEEL